MLRRRRSTSTRSTRSMALAGAGSIAVVHALAAPAAGLRVTAVASRSGRSARHLAGELDARPVAVEALPAAAEVLVVATPPDSHVDLAIAGLRAGSRVLVEKPVSSTLQEADRLAAELRRAGPGAVLHVGENLLHAPAWHALIERRDALGELTHLSLRARQPPPTWGHFAEPMAAGGVLFDLGPHPIALALAAAGEPVSSVGARLDSGRADGADDAAELELHFPSGLVASVELSWRDTTVAWDLQAASSTGVLRLELLPEVVLEHDGEPVALTPRHQVLDPRLEQMGYVDQLRSVAGLSAEPGQHLDAAIEVLEVITAAYAAAGSATTVPLPFAGPRDRTPLEWWQDPEGCSGGGER